MTVPVRVTAPVGQVVSTADLKKHLRIDGTDSDDVIVALEKAAVAHLDGYRGILGRCILSQQWSVTYEQAGTYRLPFPDVSAVTVDAGTATLLHDAVGSIVEITDPATLTLTAALPADALDAVKLAICIWVQARFDGLSGADAAAFDAAFDALVAPLRRAAL